MLALVAVSRAVFMGDSQITAEGQKFWVVDGADGRAEGVPYTEVPPLNIRTFRNRTEITAFTDVWRGAPWFVKPTEYETVNVSPVFARQIVGYTVSKGKKGRW